MKHPEDKSERPSEEVAAESGRRAVLPARSAQRTRARGEIRRGAKKIVTRREHAEDALPARTEQPAPDMPLAEHGLLHLAGSVNSNLDPNLEGLGPDDTADLSDLSLTLQHHAPEEYLTLESSAYSETLSEYLAEQEAEAAMLEADRAMSAGEYASTWDEGLEPAEVRQEEM